MKIISFREKAMLLCMLVLIFFFISIFVRLGAKQILIKRLHWDNAITHTIFFDNKILQRIEENAKHRKVDVNWKEEYPFDDAEDVTIWQKGKAFEAKIRTIEDGKIGKWCTEHLVLYRWFVEAGREVEQKIGWNVINPAMQVAKMQDGYLTFVENNKNQDERIAAVNEFADFVKSQNAEFLYIQSPGKTNPWGDSEMKGIDYSNENADRLLEGLKAKGISVYDLRQDLYEHVGSAGWHQAFFRTDHHWKPDTALWAAGRIVEKLANDYGVDVNREHFSLNDYYDDKYEKSFLGSQGKKLTLVNTELDDFDIYYPKFKTNVYIRSVISIIIGLVLSIIFGICYHTKRLGKIMKFISGKTQYRRIWRDVIDLDNGSNLKIYVKDDNYYVYGHFRNVEEHEDDPYIAVFGYGKFDKVTNKLLEYEPNHMDDDIKNDRNIYMIRMSNVDHIEIA